MNEIKGIFNRFVLSFWEGCGKSIISASQINVMVDDLNDLIYGYIYYASTYLRKSRTISLNFSGFSQ
jgi:hypothetical protein